MPCQSCSNKSSTNYDLKYVIGRFSKNRGRENLSLELDKIIESYPFLKDFKKDILDKMSVFYCQGLLDGYLGNTNQCSTFPSNFDKNDIDSFIKELSKNAYCYGYNDGILNKEKDDEIDFENKENIIKFFYSDKFRDHLPNLGIDPEIDLSKYIITHEMIQRYDASNQINTLNASAFADSSPTTPPNPNCSCEEQIFLKNIDCLYANCPSDCVGEQGQVFCSGLFADCAGVQNCEPNSSTTCTATCSIKNGCGMAKPSSGKDCSSYVSYKTTINTPNGPSIQFTSLFSIFTPRLTGLNCNSINTYPNTEYPDAYEFADCMVALCTAPYNITSTSTATCQCIINSNLDKQPWQNITYQPLNPNKIASGTFAVDNTYANNTYVTCAGIEIPTDYSNGGICSGNKPVPPAQICNPDF